MEGISLLKSKNKELIESKNLINSLFIVSLLSIFMSNLITIVYYYTGNARSEPLELAYYPNAIIINPTRTNLRITVDNS